MKKKIILGIVALFVIAVVVYLILWYVNYKSYDQYVNQEEVIYAAENGYLMENESNLLYYVKKPDFLSFTGNLVGQTEDDRISVFLWPTLFCQEIKEQGVILKTENKEDAFLLYLDEELDYDSQKNKIKIRNTTAGSKKDGFRFLPVQERRAILFLLLSGFLHRQFSVRFLFRCNSI